jgi:hypothetical protein
MPRRDSATKSDIGAWILAGLGLVGCLGLAYWILKNAEHASDTRDPDDLINAFHQKLEDLAAKLHESQTKA